MTPALAVQLVHAALQAAVLLAAPLLAVALLVGITASVAQAVTGVQEQSLPLILKLVAVGGAFLLLLPWLIAVATRFAGQAFTFAAAIGAGGQ